jgi:hypothetical protein
VFKEEGETTKTQRAQRFGRYQISLWQQVKKKSKRWIAGSFCTAESFIHLFDFFFFSSG